MKIKAFRMRTALLLAICAVVISVPLSAAAEDDTLMTSSAASQDGGMTSEDWAELQSEAEAELSAQNAEESKAAAAAADEKNRNSKGGSFKSFKDGDYVGGGEWLLIIGIILIVLGVAGIGFIAFMMFRRRKLQTSMAAKKRIASAANRPARREIASASERTEKPDPLSDDLNSLFVESGEATRTYSASRASGRRIAPKSNR